MFLSNLSGRGRRSDRRIRHADTPAHRSLSARRLRAERILKTPADSTTWLDIEQLAAVNPELAAQRWEEIKGAAYAELASGSPIS